MFTSALNKNVYSAFIQNLKELIWMCCKQCWTKPEFASNCLSLKDKNIILLKILKDWFEVTCKKMIARKTSIRSTASELIPGTCFS